MRRLLTILSTLAPATALAVCISGTTVQTLSRLGLQKPDHGYCPYDIPVGQTITTLDAVTCIANGSGGLSCGGTVPIMYPSRAWVEPVDASTDGIEIFIADRATTLVSVGCHCSNNCGTSPSLAFKDRNGNAIALTGGGNLSCGTGSSDTTFTTFDTSDADRILNSGEGVTMDTTNSPSSARIMVVFRWRDS